MISTKQVANIVSPLQADTLVCQKWRIYHRLLKVTTFDSLISFTFKGSLLLLKKVLEKAGVTELFFQNKRWQLKKLSLTAGYAARWEQIITYANLSTPPSPVSLTFETWWSVPWFLVSTDTVIWRYFQQSVQLNNMFILNSITLKNSAQTKYVAVKHECSLGGNSWLHNAL